MRKRVLNWILLVLFSVPAAAWAVTKSFDAGFITFFLLLAVFMSFGLFVIKRDLTRQNQSEIWKTDKMTDGELEEFVKELLVKQGYHADTSGEHEGISFLLRTPSGKTVAVKVKSHKKSVGVRLVQKAFKEALSLKTDECWIISNNHFFTVQAEEFARENNIRLYGRPQLIPWIINVNQGKAYTGI
ncbi:restriction endonuclease [Metabacillus sp. JX24]|uniref:restriction endonuclease n=1 Tax=Metabacillus sp. JX24 TaxID=3240759 RepID=UPI003510756B